MIFFAIRVYLFVKRKLLGLGIVIWFGVMLGVINVFFPIVGIVADRFAYIFSLGFCIVLTWVLFKVFNVPMGRVDKKIKIPHLFLLAFFFVTIIYSTRVVVRNENWHDHLSLYENDIKHLKQSAKAHALIANTVYPIIFEKIKNNPNDASVKNDIDKTIYHYEEAIRIDSNYLKCINNLASIYAIFKRDYDKAIYYSKKAIKLKPDYLEAFFNLAFSYDALNNYDQALGNYLEVLRLNPSYNKAYAKLDVLFQKHNKLDEGVLLLDELAQSHKTPKNIYLNIANFIAKRGEDNIDKALVYFEKAFNADTTDVVVCRHLIKLYELKQDSNMVNYYRKYLAN